MTSRDDRARARADDTEGAGHRLVGRSFGIPYDWRVPTAERLIRRWWDPANGHIVVPRAFGVGWDVNMGAVAVRLGLIEPDEGDPFARTPGLAFTAALALPIIVAAAVTTHYLVRTRSLPSRLPSRWNRAGDVDSWVPSSQAAVIDTAIAFGAAGTAFGARFSTASGSARAGTLAASAAVSTVIAGVTVQRSSQWVRRRIGPGLAIATMGAAGATLLGLARAGRR